MKTQNQLKAEVYNALIANATLTNRIYWLGRPTVNDTFPLLTYQVLNVNGAYAFGGTSIDRQSEIFVIQIDIYTDVSDISTMDAYVEAVKTVMETLNYRNIGSSVEFFEESINKVLVPTRWEKINV